MKEIINNLIVEHQELNLKRDKLKNFLNRYHLTERHKKLLYYQLHTMDMYLDVLELRIEDLKESEET